MLMQAHRSIPKRRDADVYRAYRRWTQVSVPSGCFVGVLRVRIKSYAQLSFIHLPLNGNSPLLDSEEAFSTL